MILGLDISTSITGYTILNNKGRIVECNHVVLKNHSDFFDKSLLMKIKLIEILEKHTINKIYIEKPFTFFNSGGSSAATMATLQKFNGTVSWMAYEIFETKPLYYTAQEARKINNIKIPKGENSKDFIVQFLLDNEPEFVIEYTKTGRPKPFIYDRADSVIIAKAGFIDEFERKTENSE